MAASSAQELHDHIISKTITDIKTLTADLERIRTRDIPNVINDLKDIGGPWIGKEIDKIESEFMQKFAGLISQVEEDFLKDASERALPQIAEDVLSLFAETL
jgi:hypothetical protein